MIASQKSLMSDISCSFSHNTFYKVQTTQSIVKIESYLMFMMVTLASVFTPILSFTSDLDEDGEPNYILHNIVIHILVAMPLFYLQIFFGQYTQTGSTNIKIMTPIARGLDLSLSITVFFRLVRNGLYQTDFILYFLLSFFKNPPWTTCPEKFKKTCWSPTETPDCKENCVTKEKHLSSYIFWKYIYMDNPEANTKFTLPLLHRFVVLVLIWFIIMLFVVSIHRYYRVLVITNFVVTIIFSFFFFMACIATGAIGKTVMERYSIKLSSLASWKSWLSTVSMVISSLGLGTACHIEHGTDLGLHMSTDFVSILAVMMLFMQSFILFLITLCTAALVGQNDRIPNLDSIFYNDVLPNYTVIPSGISLLPVPLAWLVCHNLFCILSAATSQIVEILVLQRCIIETYPRMIRYLHYITFLMVVCIIIVSFFFLCNHLLDFTVFFCLHTIRTIEAVNTFIFTLSTCYIYGVRHICDDVHFFSGKPPAVFWKVTWVALPIVLLPPLISNFTEMHNVKRKTKILHWLVILFALWPIPVMALLEFVNKAKENNLLGVLKPLERWGPIDPEERYNRRRFKPREEIRCKAKHLKCIHSCLQQSGIIYDVVRREKEKRTNSN